MRLSDIHKGDVIVLKQTPDEPVIVEGMEDPINMWGKSTGSEKNRMIWGRDHVQDMIGFRMRDIININGINV